MKNLLSILILTILISCGQGGSSSSLSLQESNQDTTSTDSPTTKDPLKYAELVSPEGQTIRSSIASTAAEQTKGLQGVRDNEFAEDEGKLFFYLSTSTRSFWMPNTYFNLDIIYLDQNLKILNIVWNIPHYTGNVNSEIPRAPAITSRHVLEMKAGSLISSRLKIGDTLGWKSSLSLDELENKIRNRN